MRLGGYSNLGNGHSAPVPRRCPSERRHHPQGSGASVVRADHSRHSEPFCTLPRCCQRRHLNRSESEALRPDYVSSREIIDTCTPSPPFAWVVRGDARTAMPLVIIMSRYLRRVWVGSTRDPHCLALLVTGWPQPGRFEVAAPFAIASCYGIT